MHALFLTPGFPPFDGGGERYARSLALALAAREQQLTVVTSQAQREQQFWQGTAGAAVSRERDGPLTVIRVPLRPFPGGWRGLLVWRKAMVMLSLLPGDQTQLLMAMARHVPPMLGLEEALAQLPDSLTLVHGFNLSWEHALVAAAGFACQRNLHFVMTPFTHLGGRGSTRVARNATMDHQRRLLNQADAVLALTSVEQEEFSQWDIHPRRVVVVGGGVDPPPPLKDPAAIGARFQLKPPFALFVGRANLDKGAIHAAQATLRLAENGSTLTLALAGRVGEDFRRFRRRLTPAQQAIVRPLGTVDEVAKHALLQQASMLLLPSQVDSFGIVLLEAWQHGTPVIGARAGGIPAVVDDGENGLIVPFADVPALTSAMQRLLTDEAASQIMGRRGQEKVGHEYTWDRVAARVLSVYTEVTGTLEEPVT